MEDTESRITLFHAGHRGPRFLIARAYCDRGDEASLARVMLRNARGWGVLSSIDIRIKAPGLPDECFDEDKLDLLENWSAYKKKQAQAGG